MLKIYLADLVYDTINTNHAVPLNSGYLAAMIKDKFPGKTEIKIFKYPKKLEKAINEDPPDILGLSNYSWNTNLNKLFLKMVKRLNQNVVTVMGGPNIRIDSTSIEKYLRANLTLDYYVMFEGEEPFAELVGAVMAGHQRPSPPSGCATIIDDEFIYVPREFNIKSKNIDSPSPYLAGLLDDFLEDQDMIPLIETNRGCPHGCVYCIWGISALSKVRQRSLEVVFQELDYVADKCAGQLFWIFCDANFGILPRDVEIAKKLREIRERKGYPTRININQSKNTTQRNIEIANILVDNYGYIAIQSADPLVLKNSGRANTNFSEIKKYVNYYRNNKIITLTDILIGLPGESAESHLKTLGEVFNLGFDKIQPYNIRLLPGSKYETDDFRKKYQVKTKFRPIFGCYGIYDGEIVFELEESVRATKDITEIELDYFKTIHWLIYFAWDADVFKPILYFARKHGVNPFTVIHKLSLSKHPVLEKFFREMREKSMSEWFDTAEAMTSYYKKRDNYNELVNNFVKLNFLFIAVAYHKDEIIESLKNEMVNIIISEIKKNYNVNYNTLEAILCLTDKLICKDLLQEEFSVIGEYPREVVSVVLNKDDLVNNNVKVEIYRPKDYVDFCNFYLNQNNKKDLSIQNITRFLEIGGIEMLMNKVRLI
jgi:putative methyltransferase